MREGGREGGRKESREGGRERERRGGGGGGGVREVALHQEALSSKGRGRGCPEGLLQVSSFNPQGLYTCTVRHIKGKI